jgi:hypothetical protein
VRATNTTGMPLRRIVLREDVTGDDVGAAAYSANWRIKQILDADRHNPREVIYQVTPKRTFVHYIEDSLLGIDYLVIQGEELDEVEARTRAALPALSEQEVRMMMGTAVTADEQVRALPCAALVAPVSFDVEFYRWFEHALHSPEARVRKLTILATGYVGWREFCAPLAELASTDGDSQVREDARAMLESFAKSPAVANSLPIRKSSELEGI